MGHRHLSSAFGVVHKAVTDGDDPAMRAPVKRAPGKPDIAGIRAKLRPLKDDAVRAAKAVKKV